MNYYSSIKELLIDNELTKKAKDYSKNRRDIITYYNVGKLLKEAGKRYGDNIIGEYSKKLVVEVGKKYNRRTLFRMRQFYNIFCNQKVSRLATQLSISHYIELLSLKNINEINYYIDICKRNNLTRDELRKRIKRKEYWSFDENTRNKIVNNEPVEIVDTVKNPIFIRNTTGIDNISEKMLQKLILENLNDFLKELGEGYSYIENEYKIKIGNKYNYIDILLFNYIYNAFVVVELKVTELKKEHIGQTMVYMNYIDEHVKSINQNKTIGIIIVKEDNKFIMHYCNDDKIISREYELI